jgi:hypothetical protein
VRGVESLSAYRYQRTSSGSRPLTAAILGFIPGMGAVYNRQNVKAVVHFFTVVGLFQLTRFHLVPGLFALGGFAFYVYSIIDAHRTAQLISRGESAAADEERFKRALIRRAPALGVLLIIAGILFVINIIRPVAMIAIAKLFPILLILLGGYLLTRYFKDRRDHVDPDYSPKTPYSLVPGSFGSHGSEQVRRFSRPGPR